MSKCNPGGLTKCGVMAVSILLVLIYLFNNSDANAFGNYDAEYLTNYDADSITLKVWLWPSTSKTTGLYAIENMRLYGVDTPEKGWRAKCPREAIMADEATSYVTKLLEGQKHLLVDVQPARGARGRPLIRIWVQTGGKDLESLADLLVNKGYARVYFRGKRLGWCGTSILLPEGASIGGIA